MNNLRQAAQQALEAMDKATRFMSDADYKKLNQAIDDLRAALAEPQCMCREPWALERVHREKTPCFDYVERKPQTTHWEGCEAVHPECKTELERKSDAIQRLWKERDELRSECRTLVRQNGEWQELHAELAEALRQVEGMLKLSPHALSITRAALAKARMREKNGS